MACRDGGHPSSVTSVACQDRTIAPFQLINPSSETEGRTSPSKNRPVFKIEDREPVGAREKIASQRSVRKCEALVGGDNKMVHVQPGDFLVWGN